MEKIDEALLLIQLKAGYDRAVRDWFVYYSPTIRKTVSKRLSVEADIEELVQEIFLACLRELVHFRGESTLTTWMLTITHHKIADYYRAQYAKKVVHLVTLLDGIPASLTDSNDVREFVKKALAKLSQFEQELLLAKYVDGKSVSELAIEFKKTLKAIESLLFRARNSFRKEYLAVINETYG